MKAILVDGPSHSGYPFRAPMRLRYNYSSKVKLASLIHELGHRLIINVSRANSSVDSHSILFLFLYDIWVDLKGEAFANKMVEVEKTRGKR
ncbi:MAG: hypothetical protein KC478_16925, partial [Bacteriovoracaceae bacterium]|nr:hypothetical protein [Bacteriovoracaceae bacterium]